jgi:phospholipase/lecithinase/hemolysin
MRCTRILGLVGLALAAWATAPDASAFTKMVVLGDSLSDGGNRFYRDGGLVSSPPFETVPDYAYDRAPLPGNFTNGRAAAEYLAQSLGLELLPSWGPGGGTNFAFGGAETVCVDGA